MATPRKNPDKPLRVLDDVRSHRFRRVITEAWLRPRWLSDAPLSRVAEEAGCCEATIRSYAARFRLPLVRSWVVISTEKGWEEVLTPAFLQAAYVEGCITVQAIAAEVGCHSGTVVRHLMAHGIPRRGKRPGVDNVLYEDKLTAEFISERLGEKANLQDIAREVGCTSTAVRLAVRRLGLEHLVVGARPPEPPCASPADLRRLFEQEGLSMNAIGSMLGLSRTKVRADLSRFGIRPYARPGFKRTDNAWLA